MAEKMDISKKKCLTPEFRVSFPNVFEPKLFEGKSTPEYSVVMTFPKVTRLDKVAKGSGVSLKEAARNAAIEMWGPDDKKWPKNMRSPFRDGGEKSDVAGYGDDIIFVTAKSKMQPGLVDAKLREIISPEDFYAGCYARAEVIAFAYDQSGNKGVSFSLQNIQKLRDGEPFGGRRNASTVFEAVESDDEEEAEEADDGLGF